MINSSPRWSDWLIASNEDHFFWLKLLLFYPQQGKQFRWNRSSSYINIQQFTWKLLTKKYRKMERIMLLSFLLNSNDLPMYCRQIVYIWILPKWANKERLRIIVWLLYYWPCCQRFPVWFTLKILQSALLPSMLEQQSITLSSSSIITNLKMYHSLSAVGPSQQRVPILPRRKYFC